MNANEKTTVSLPAGQVLKLTVPTGATGLNTRLSDSAGGEPYAPVAVNGVNLSFGPYGSPRRYALSCTVGSFTYAIAPYDPSSDASDTAYATAAQGVKADAAVPKAGVHSKVVTGGAAGAITVTGIPATATLLAVIVFVGAGTAVTDINELSGEFTVTGVNTIDNTGGTSTSGAKLLVTWSV
jgi:hypothetical protein